MRLELAGHPAFWKRKTCWVLSVFSGTCVCVNPREKGRKEKESLQQLAEVTREGFRLKKMLIEEWKTAREEKQVRDQRDVWVRPPGPGISERRRANAVECTLDVGL